MENIKIQKNINNSKILNQSKNESINESINESKNESINKSKNESKNESKKEINKMECMAAKKFPTKGQAFKALSDKKLVYLVKESNNGTYKFVPYGKCCNAIQDTELCHIHQAQKNKGSKSFLYFEKDIQNNCDDNSIKEAKLDNKYFNGMGDRGRNKNFKETVFDFKNNDDPILKILTMTKNPQLLNDLRIYSCQLLRNNNIHVPNEHKNINEHKKKEEKEHKSQNKELLETINRLKQNFKINDNIQENSKKNSDDSDDDSDDDSYTNSNLITDFNENEETKLFIGNNDDNISNITNDLNDIYTKDDEISIFSQSNLINKKSLVKHTNIKKNNTNIDSNTEDNNIDSDIDSNIKNTNILSDTEDNNIDSDIEDNNIDSIIKNTNILSDTEDNNIDSDIEDNNILSDTEDNNNINDDDDDDLSIEVSCIYTKKGEMLYLNENNNDIFTPEDNDGQIIGKLYEINEKYSTIVFKDKYYTVLCQDKINYQNNNEVKSYFKDYFNNNIFDKDLDFKGKVEFTKNVPKFRFK